MAWRETRAELTYDHERMTAAETVFVTTAAGILSALLIAFTVETRRAEMRGRLNSGWCVTVIIFGAVGLLVALGMLRTDEASETGMRMLGFATAAVTIGVALLLLFPYLDRLTRVVRGIVEPTVTRSRICLGVTFLFLAPAMIIAEHSEEASVALGFGAVVSLLLGRVLDPRIPVPDEDAGSKDGSPGGL